MDQELRTSLEGMETRLKTHVDAVEIRMKEHVETVETRLLTEFWKWARTSDMKSRHRATTIGSLELRGRI
jgi:hypothetical protein